MSFYNSDGDYADTAPTCVFVIQHRPSYIECGVALTESDDLDAEMCANHSAYARGER